jgi:hypothetical protein
VVPTKKERRPSSAVSKSAAAERRKGRRPIVIASPEVAALGPLDPEPGPHAPSDPGWRPSLERLARHSAAVQAASERSTDPDACAARVLAAHLNRMADEFEAFEPENALLPPERRAGDREIVENHRALVKALVRTLNRNERDEWITLFELVEQIENAAFVRMRPEELNPDALWAAHANYVIEHLVSGFRALHPREAEKVTPSMIRAALDASHDPKKGAPKWESFVPIAKAIVGETDPTALRLEIFRLRQRQPM